MKQEAVEEIFETLMGDEVRPRREFIDDNALRARTLISKNKKVLFNIFFRDSS